jgi:pyruvyl transferase EpsI
VEDTVCRKKITGGRTGVKSWAESFRAATRRLDNLLFAGSRWRLRGERKIFYAGTPPPRLKNVGDHAQAIAIRTWLKKHFPDLRVVETDRDQTEYHLPALKWLVKPGDVFFLQSGGNMGDRHKRAERTRRSVISSFPGNQIVCLPQTISFRDTLSGVEELEKTRRIYASHPRLTVIARDPRSFDLARELFPGARTLCMPDFALLLPSTPGDTGNNPSRALLCLRSDGE